MRKKNSLFCELEFPVIFERNSSTTYCYRARIDGFALKIEPEKRGNSLLIETVLSGARSLSLLIIMSFERSGFGLVRTAGDRTQAENFNVFNGPL
jgi:hypothetical protein